MGNPRDDVTARERPTNDERLDTTKLPGVPAVTEPPDDATLPATPPGKVPSKIGRFEIQRKLGEGGMGVVLLAFDPTLQRQVALKLLHDGAGAGDDSRRRLVREAQAVAKVVDEHVIVVHEVGTHDDHVFVAMEYVAGGTLGTWQRGRPWREVLDAYLRAGDGLRAAHEAGLIHRDFKPDNVLVGTDGRLRVTDFGLVASADAPPETALAMPRAGNELAASLTRTGAVMGTPRFMAPEQHLAEPLDARADQFAFCAALYEALYGAPPFPGNMIAVIAARVCAGEVEPITNTEVPASIGAAILRGLSRDRADRFPSMTELLDALVPPAAVAVPPVRERRRWPLFAGLGAAVVALAVVAVLWLRPAHDTPLVGLEHAEASAYAREGTRLVAEKKFREAAEQLEASLAWVEDALVRYTLAIAYAELGRHDDALRSVDQALADPTLEPRAVPMMRTMREALVHEQRTSDGPRPWAVGVSKDDQARALEVFNRGNAAMQQANYRDAGAAYEQALRVWNHPAIHFNLAMVLLNLDRAREALDHLDIALVYPDALEPAMIEGSRRLRTSILNTLRAKESK